MNKRQYRVKISGGLCVHVGCTSKRAKHSIALCLKHIHDVRLAMRKLRRCNAKVPGGRGRPTVEMIAAGVR